jgi:hypothetical protein
MRGRTEGVVVHGMAAVTGIVMGGTTNTSITVTTWGCGRGRFNRAVMSLAAVTLGVVGSRMMMVTMTIQKGEEWER